MRYKLTNATMSEKRSNNWLDNGESEDSETDYSNNVVEDSKGEILSRRSKKRRISKLQRLGSSFSEVSDATGTDDDLSRNVNGMSNSSALEEKKADVTTSKSQNLAESKLFRQAESFREKSSRTGVIYISRVPPFMKPQKVRNLLSPYGPIGRVFLSPEDAVVHTRRVKLGGNKKRSYTDGWVEFINKKDAKLVAEALNAQSIGGKKGNWYHDDVWNIKYLKGFKWDNLTEQIASQNAAIADKLRREIAQSTKETNIFLENVERAKMLDNIKTKKSGGSTRETSQHSTRNEFSEDRWTRKFVQNNPGIRRSNSEASKNAQTNRILRKII